MLVSGVRDRSIPDQLYEHLINTIMTKQRENSRIDPDAVELSFLEKVAKRLPEDVEVLQALAELYTRNGRFKEGLDVDIQLTRHLPGDDLVWYNLACSYALTKSSNLAFEALTKAVELGYDDYDWMKSDSDLNSLHDDPRFESLLSWLYSACNDDEGNF
jgi:tetratricopeptide (TPR) repeat protein